MLQLPPSVDSILISLYAFRADSYNHVVNFDSFLTDSCRLIVAGNSFAQGRSLRSQDSIMIIGKTLVIQIGAHYVSQALPTSKGASAQCTPAPDRLDVSQITLEIPKRRPIAVSLP